MDDAAREQIRRVLEHVRFWRIGVERGAHEIEEILKGGAPTTPPDTGTTLPRASRRIYEVVGFTGGPPTWQIH